MPSGVDAILTPATPSPAFAQGEKGSADPVEMYLNDVFTVTVNMAGLPGLVVPAGLSSDGLPLGLQLIGRPFEEETLFALGAGHRAGGAENRLCPKPGGVDEDERADSGRQPPRIAEMAALRENIDALDASAGRPARRAAALHRERRRDQEPHRLARAHSAARRRGAGARRSRARGAENSMPTWRGRSGPRSSNGRLAMKSA